jgi:TRAP-type C4-dicarboxylate transport system permease small subunit
MHSLIKNRLTRNIIAFTILSLVFMPMAGVLALEVGITEVEETIELGKRDIRSTIASIINVAMGLLGIIAVGIILIGGFQWMTAGGNEENVEKAKKRIIQGVIGLAIILASWAIARFVLESLVTATAE